MTAITPICQCCHCRVCRAEELARDAEAPKPKPEPDYWLLAKRPLACLIFLLPLLLLYEAGVAWTGGDNPIAVRNGADAWIRQGLATAGVPFGFLPPLLIASVLLVWHVWIRDPWKTSGETLMGMFAESILFALVLIVAGQVQNIAFEKLGNPEVPLALEIESAEAGNPLARDRAALAVSYVGAGIYEEAIFRLCLLPVGFGAFRLLGLGKNWAATLAVIATSLMFAVAHHVGPTGEAFRLFPFTFRLTAGLFFSGLFVLRGFGVTVGTHALYDLIVGLLLSPVP